MYSLAMQPDASSSPRRSGTLLQEPRFPILTLDESKLTPALGYVFRRKWLYPHESLISILWKFEKANAFYEHQIVKGLFCSFRLMCGCVAVWLANC